MLAGQFRRGRASHKVDLLLLFGNALHGERHRRRGQFHDGVDLFGIIPLTGDIGGNVRLVLVVGGDNLNRCVQHLAAEILGSHLRCFIGPFAAKIRINTGLVIEDADLDLAVGNLGTCCGNDRRCHQRRRCNR